MSPDKDEETGAMQPQGHEQGPSSPPLRQNDPSAPGTALEPDPDPGPCPCPAQPPDPGLDLEERVLLKEEAVNKSFKYLEEARAILDGVSSDYGPIQQWADLHDDLKKERYNLEVLVGVAGETGFGKTTLLNVLVGGKDELVPSNQSQACTAAVCTFSYNRSDGDNYQATVFFKSRETVEHELDAFLCEYQEVLRDLDSNEQDHISGESRNQLTRQLKVIQNWTGLSADEIDATSSSTTGSIILDKSLQQTGHIFSADHLAGGTTTNVSAKKPSEFLRRIRPYIDSSTKAGTKNGKTLYWPLVEKVQIFVKNEALEHGITLVDLPGESDALDSRASIARDYYSRLDRTMVVCHSIRGIDNRVAWNLLVSQAVDSIDLEGQDRLCVVVTKIDDIDIRSLLGQEDYVDDLPKLARDAFSRKEKLEAQLDGDGEEEVDDETVPRLQKELREANETLAMACIQSRNRDLTAKIRDAFAATKQEVGIGNNEAPNEQDAHPLPVFTVSSKAYKACQAKSPLEGFPDIASTGIGHVLTWLHEISLPRRDEHASRLFHKASVLMDGIDDLVEAEDTSSGSLTKEEVKVVWSYMNNLKTKLVQDLEHTAGNFKQLLKTHDPFKPSQQSTASNPERGNEPILACLTAARSNFHSKVESWGKKTHWSTYAACVRRAGKKYTSVGTKRSHHWLGDLVRDFRRGFDARWVRSFNTRLPDNKKKHAGHLTHNVTNFIKGLGCESTQFPDSIKVALPSIGYKIENDLLSHLDLVNDDLRHFHVQARQQRDQVEVYLGQPMTPGFNQAKDVKGKGKFQAQKKILDAFAYEVDGEPTEDSRKSTGIYQHALIKTGKDLDQSRKELHATLKARNGHLVSKIMDHVKRVINSQSPGSRNQERAGKGGGKGKRVSKRLKGIELRPICENFKKHVSDVRAQLPEDAFRLDHPRFGVESNDAAGPDEPEAQSKKAKKAKKAKKGNTGGGKGKRKALGQATTKRGRNKGPMKSDELIKDESDSDDAAPKKKRVKIEGDVGTTESAERAEEAVSHQDSSEA